VKHLCLLVFVVGCAADSAVETVSVTEQEATVCGVGPTVKGIDVSYYQGTINWTAVKNDGVKFAFIRVSDGLNTIDNKFATNWSGSRAAGVKHGAYQFFRPSQDPIAQADLLLAKIGSKLEPDDLPPVIDVEASDGQSAATITTKVKKWVAHVKAATGRDPIIYTGF
jgi:lysozyme